MKRKERDDDYDDEEEEEEEEEEEKMEKFFALIRSTRKVRELIMRASDKFDVNREKKLAPAGAWRPVFRPEDFMEDDGPALVIDDQEGPSRREGENKGKEEENKEEDEESEGEGEKGKEKDDDDDDDGLNLKLSL
ncbi:hypothetical protein LguiB_006412 [Lonicera macranthoides]